MKARIFYSADKGILGSIRYANCTESDDWHFTADFMTLKDLSQGATKALNQNFANKARTRDGGKTWDLMAENQGFDTLLVYNIFRIVMGNH
jgi:hypothetical protein